jgi:folate-binding protein YgfZ
MDLAFFDRTMRGRLIVTGRERKDLLHRLATNAILPLHAGQGTSTCFCTNKGRLIDWTPVLDRGDDLLILSANPERLAGHIAQYTITEDVTVRNYMAIEIVICGPGAAGFLGVSLAPWQFTDADLGGVRVQIVRIEPLFGDAYAILAPDAVALRRLLLERGRQLDPPDVDALRVEWGIPAVPNEINEERNPWELGLDESISLTKGCYIGQEIIARIHTYKKLRKKLAGLRLAAPCAPGTKLTRAGAEVAEVTTVAGDRALALVDIECLAPGTALDGATVVELPMAGGATGAS